MLDNGSPVFARLECLPGVSRLRTLSGSVIGFALYNEISIPCVVDWTTQVVVRLRDLPEVTVRPFASVLYSN